MANDNDEQSAPGFARPVLVGIASVILGVLLAGFNLARGPVEEVTVLPDPENRERHTFYYVTGQERGASNWAAYRVALAEGTARNFAITEVDLNQWAARRLESPPVAEGEEPPVVSVHPPSLNFRLDGDRMQIGMLLDVRIPFVGEQRVLYVTEGAFERRRGGYRFVPARAHVNRCSIPLGALRQLTFDWVLGSARAMDEIQELAEHWREIRDLRIEDERLYFTLAE